MRKTPLLIATALMALASVTATTTATAQNRGLMPAADALGGAYWQGRFEASTPVSPPVSPRSILALGLPASPTQTLRLLSDYQFSAMRLGNTGGLRLTGGLLINLRNPSSTGVAENLGALPYAGIGYSSGDLSGDWALSADFGLAAPGLSPARMDRLFGPAGSSSGLGLDASARLLPMVRLGMTLAF